MTHDRRMTHFRFRHKKIFGSFRFVHSGSKLQGLPATLQADDAVTVSPPSFFLLVRDLAVVVGGRSAMPRIGRGGDRRASE